METDYPKIVEKIVEKELGLKTISIKNLTVGWSGAGVYLVETPNKKLIVKMRENEEEVSFESEPVDNKVYGGRFSNLVPAQKLLKENKILVPEIFAFGAEDKYKYAVMEYLEGDTKVPQDIVGEEFGKIHKIIRDYQGWINTSSKTNWKEDFFTAFEIQLQKATKVSSVIKENLSKIQGYISNKKSEWINPKEFVFSHTDGFQGLAKEENGKTVFVGMIDIEDYQFTDQRFVLAGYELLSEWWMKEKLTDKFWNNYKKHKEVEPGYESFKNLFQVFYILSWIPGYYINWQGDKNEQQRTIDEAEKRIIDKVS